MYTTGGVLTERGVAANLDTLKVLYYGRSSTVNSVLFARKIAGDEGYQASLAILKFLA